MGLHQFAMTMNIPCQQHSEGTSPSMYLYFISGNYWYGQVQATLKHLAWLNDLFSLLHLSLPFRQSLISQSKHIACYPSHQGTSVNPVTTFSYKICRNLFNSLFPGCYKTHSLSILCLIFISWILKKKKKKPEKDSNFLASWQCYDFSCQHADAECPLNQCGFSDQQGHTEASINNT